VDIVEILAKIVHLKAIFLMHWVGHALSFPLVELATHNVHHHIELLLDHLEVQLWKVGKTEFLSSFDAKSCCQAFSSTYFDQN